MMFDMKFDINLLYVACQFIYKLSSIVLVGYPLPGYPLSIDFVIQNTNKMFVFFDYQLRRQARLRREYIYRKTIEERDKSIQEKKEKLRSAIEGRFSKYTMYEFNIVVVK